MEPEMQDRRLAATESARPFEELRQQLPPEVRARIDARLERTLARVALSQLRKAIGQTQVDMARALGVGQASVSKIESSADMYLSTLRRYIEALGGELRVQARFAGDHVVEIERLSSAVSASKKSVDGPRARGSAVKRPLIRSVDTAAKPASKSASAAKPAPRRAKSRGRVR
jgi:transcriptional regulator with XRE-family HTH domain